MKTQPCTLCEAKSIPGLIRGAGKCAYHWAELHWGTKWAAKCHPDHPEAKAYLRKAIAKAEGKQ